ncbi:serine palmitoyltransferase 1 [Trichuris trichiura]|uniref:Serine palmitoyltransferase 1 n=1 Tax=Trichuris trichiura TaxID=36087 RepID=A0A077Z5P8_TRITR|nr:serine palmitoyltransferase 1 [Trichuris trichiura]
MDQLLGPFCSFGYSVDLVRSQRLVSLLVADLSVYGLFCQEIEELIAEWQPQRLTPLVDPTDPVLKRPIVEGKLDKYVVIENKEYLNFGTMNFLGLACHPSVEEAAINAVRRLGVGTCGPRAFYGTMDVHLQLEDRLAKFMGTEEAALYSYGICTVASAIPAYCKRGDVIFCDRGVHFAIQKGLQASRSRIEFFAHNDTADLERLLMIQAEKDRLNPKKARVTRRFVIVEGIYLYYGDICPLPELLRLKWKYKVRIFIDESVSFGVLGRTGRGVVEYFNANIDEVDMISSSLENANGSTGGFTCGRSFVIGHQRLSASGYCFSASLPSPLTAGALRSLEIMIEDPERLARLRRNSSIFHKAMQNLNRFKVDGVAGSPLFHLRVPPGQDDDRLLDTLIEKAMNEGILLTKMSTLKSQEWFCIPESIKISLSSEHTMEEIERLLVVIDSVDKA